MEADETMRGGDGMGWAGKNECTTNSANLAAFSQCRAARRLSVSRPCSRRNAAKGFSAGPRSRSIYKAL
jgi:hypothetical protein